MIRSIKRKKLILDFADEWKGKEKARVIFEDITKDRKMLKLRDINISNNYLR